MRSFFLPLSLLLLSLAGCAGGAARSYDTSTPCAGGREASYQCQVYRYEMSGY